MSNEEDVDPDLVALRNSQSLWFPPPALLEYTLKAAAIGARKAQAEIDSLKAQLEAVRAELKKRHTLAQVLADVGGEQEAELTALRAVVGELCDALNEELDNSHIGPPRGELIARAQALLEESL
jgi:hypothetical protein